MVPPLTVPDILPNKVVTAATFLQQERLVATEVMKHVLQQHYPMVTAAHAACILAQLKSHARMCIELKQ